MKLSKRAPRRQSRAEKRVVQAAIEDLLELFYGPQSDEAAAHIGEFLSRLALRFEETHASAIARYNDSLVAHRSIAIDIDTRQLDLFTNDEPF